MRGVKGCSTSPASAVNTCWVRRAARGWWRGLKRFRVVMARLRSTAWSVEDALTLAFAGRSREMAAVL